MEFRRCFGFCFVNGFVAINVIEFRLWLCFCSVLIQPNSIDKRKKMNSFKDFLKRDFNRDSLCRTNISTYFFFPSLCCAALVSTFLLCSVCFEIYSCLSTIVIELKWRDKYVYPYPQFKQFCISIRLNGISESIGFVWLVWSCHDTLVIMHILFGK